MVLFWVLSLLVAECGSGKRAAEANEENEAKAALFLTGLTG